LYIANIVWRNKDVQYYVRVKNDAFPHAACNTAERRDY